MNTLNIDLQNKIECIANISEGRNQSTIEFISNAISSTHDVLLLNVDSGYAVNRTVFTFLGELEPIMEATYKMYLAASQKIDMSLQLGTHPRMGAVDVCPFVVLDNQNEDLKNKLNRAIEKLASQIATQLELPIYLYEHSSKTAQRKRLSSIRKGEYEGWKTKILTPEWIPDFGPAKWNIKLGGSVMGRRDLLLAFNINIKGGSIDIAKKMANEIREISNNTQNILNCKHKGLRAIGWYLEDIDQIQLSMNITDIVSSPLYHVWESAEKLADHFGVTINGSELIGMIPESSLAMAADFWNMKGDKFEKMQQVAEKLGLQSIKPFSIEKNVLWGV